MTPVKHQCAGCGLRANGTKTAHDNTTSHGICEDCFIEMLGQGWYQLTASEQGKLYTQLSVDQQLKLDALLYGISDAELVAMNDFAFAI